MIITDVVDTYFASKQMKMPAALLLNPSFSFGLLAKLKISQSYDLKSKLERSFYYILHYMLRQDLLVLDCCDPNCAGPARFYITVSSCTF